VERGQSTVEVAIAFPVVVILLWWAVVSPLAGVRAVAARTAAVGEVRRATAEDAPETAATAARVREAWQRMTGATGIREVKATLSGRQLTVVARETEPGPGRIRDFTLTLPQEED
jgi:hypothetical protein